MRYLNRVENDEPFAYARSRRDFFLVSDDTLWAHESHKWLLSAASSDRIVHRIGNLFYDVESGVPLYYESSEPPAPGTAGDVGNETAHRTGH
jgi:hypothetical protein